MNQNYTEVRNAQIVLYLLKARGIRKVVASPGTQNMAIVVSMQHDPYFEMYSAVDERSAAYMACGLAAESGEPVVLSCTGATASRNYLSGLTEAYYRHLPVVAITSSAPLAMIGHNIAQTIDRSQIQKDVAKISVVARTVRTPQDEWDCTVQVNKALLELYHHGIGPVHINIEKTDGDFHVEELPKARVIDRICYGDTFPTLPNGKISIFVGAHPVWSDALTKAVDTFCRKFNAAVFCDQTSNYHGEFAIRGSIIASQDWYLSPIFATSLLIHIGDVSGDYYLTGKVGRAKEVWRVCEDGEIKDTFKKLTNVFEMSELSFFEHYNSLTEEKNTDFTGTYLQECKDELSKIKNKIPELPFSNIWIAGELSRHLPQNSILHFGILNSLRAWNFAEIDASISTFCNVGGFGIDGGMSALVGSSLAHPDKLHFGFFGDLAFFYDMNVLGNRHVGKNLRILMVNNAKGTEFRLYSHPASLLGEDADEYISAARHFGNKSPHLVRHYAEDLGFEYLTASNKEEFTAAMSVFVDPMIKEKPILFEIFTDSVDENNALSLLNNIEKSKENQRKDKIKKLIGEENAHAIQRLINKLKS